MMRAGFHGAQILVAAMVLATHALAQQEVISPAQEQEPASPEQQVVPSLVAAPRRQGSERAEVRLRYGADYFHGNLRDNGPGLDYSGVTENDVALWGALWPFRFGGAEISAQREAIRLYNVNGNALLTGGGMLRIEGGPTARFHLKALTLHTLVGYSFSQLPIFKNSAGPSFAPATRHAALVSARLQIPLSARLRLDVQAEYPIALAVQAEGQQARSSGPSGFTGGAALVRDIAVWNGLRASLLVDYHFSYDAISWTTTTTNAAGQGIPVSKVSALWGHRYGLGMSFQWENDVRRVSRGSEVVSLPGLEVGSLSVSVAMKEDGTPVADAMVSIGDEELATDENGIATLLNMKPGPVNVRVEREGMQLASEVAQIVAGSQSEIRLSLVPAGIRQPAKISGFVKSAVGGAPLPAIVSISAANIVTSADTNGYFHIALPGSRYSVTISARGYQSQRRLIRVRDAEEAVFNVNLEPVRRE